MNFRPAPMLCCLCLAAGQAGAALSSWDEMQLRWLQQYSTPLRWDNVEGSPHWVSGPKPRREFQQRLHFFHLQPGEEVTLHGAANTWLRLAGAGRTLRREDLGIGVSTDGRMFIETAPVSTRDPYSLLVELPKDRPSLVRLALPQPAESNLVFVVYFSRVEPFNTLTPYRETVRLPGETVRIRRTGEAASQPARLLKPEESVEFSINGPAWLQLVTRLRWPRNEPRREQSLFLLITRDGEDQIPLLLCPKLDARHRTRADHSTELVSHRMNGYFSVPEGRHQLRINTAVPVYLSVFRQADPDFLLPWLNGPAKNVMPLLPVDLGHFPDVSPFTAKPLSPPWSASDLVALEQEAVRLARDNRPMEAGAQAADLLNRLSDSRPDYPAARLTAEAIWRERTFYREVLPSVLSEEQSLRKVCFVPNRLRPLFGPEQRLVVANPTLEQVNSMLAEGRFAVVPPRLSPGLRYELPVRAYDSSLRVAAMTSTTNRARLLVQFDQESPFQVALEAAAPSGQEIAASDALATLRVLEREVHLPAGVKVEPPVGEFDLPSPLSQPGVIELPLPQHVRQVRIQLEAADAPVLTSVAFRAAKPFAFGEEGYVALLNQVGSTAAMQVLTHPQQTEQTASERLRELHNHLLPLTRFLKAHFNDFTNGLDLASLPRTVRLHSGEQVATLKSAALSLEQSGQFIEATEIWNRLFWEGDATAHLEAALAIMRCLDALGEDFLAEQYARFVLLRSNVSGQSAEGAVADGPPDSAPAVELLENRARQSDDPEQVEQLRAFLFVRCPCQTHLAVLTEALVRNGQDELALSAGLILPREDRPVEPLLLAALHRNWWRTFDELVEGLRDNDEKCFWRAQKHLAFHHFVEAEQELKQSNEKGREMLRALQAGIRIREQLSAPAPNERLAALLAWEDWHLHQPGPKTWQPVQDVLLECSGTELLFNCEWGRFTSYLRAERGAPVRLRFLGPLRLQVEARPILAVPSSGPVNDWLEVVEYGLTNRIPVSQCVPNSSLQFTVSRNALVGVKTVAVLDYGPGWHEVEVAVANHAALIRVLQEQPVLPIRALPVLNPDRVNLVLQPGQEAGTAQVQERKGKRSDLWWVSPDLARPKPPHDRASLLLATNVPGDEAKESAGLTDLERLRLALRRESKPGQPFQYDSHLLQSLPPTEQWLAVCRAKRWADFTNWPVLPDSAQVSSWLSAGRVQELLDSEVPRDVLQRLTTLLEVSELFPAWREQAVCLAELLVAPTNCPPGGNKVLSRITEDRTWFPLTVSPLSAGIKPLQTLSDAPQDPTMRLRRALLPPSGTNHFTLSAQSVFEGAMRLQHPAHVQLQAGLAKAGLSPAIPLTVALQVDAREVQRLSLAHPKFEAGTDFMLSDGAHRVRMWIEDPVANQFVRLTFSGKSEAPTNALWSQSVSELASERRFFHVATMEQPVRFAWRGPALLRVDEYREGRFASQLRFVPRGEQTVEVLPSPGRAESWYQVFVRSTQTNLPETRMASTIREPEEVPPPPLRLPPSTATSSVELTDNYELGGQEDGTWTPSLLWVQRRPFEISDSQDTVENEFVEANIAYRKVNPSETVWFKTEALGRLHRSGDLTFGLSERIEGHPQASPFDWTWLGEAFVGPAGPQQRDVQWALHTELELGERFQLNRKLDWYPFAGLFAHYLSLDPSDASQYDYIDQDLYTSFKQEHQWGGVLGNRLEYQPWLDTLLKGVVYLKSNENFSPDDWGVSFSWNQLMGSIRGEVAYQFRCFLKDADRSSRSSLQGVSASLYAEHWIGGRHRIEVGAQFRHDWPDSGDSYFLVIRWDFSQGRRYKDFGPGEMLFRDLRSRRIAAAFNNHLQPGLPVTSLP